MIYIHLKFVLPDPPGSPIINLIPLLFVIIVTGLKQVGLSYFKRNDFYIFVYSLF
jgi:hypothetical protein